MALSGRLLRAGIPGDRSAGRTAGQHHSLQQIQRLTHLKVPILQAFRAAFPRCVVATRGFVFQVPRKISLAGSRVGRRIGKLQSSAHNVGLDSGCLDRAVVRRVIAGGSQFQCCPVVMGRMVCTEPLPNVLAPSISARP